MSETEVSGYLNPKAPGDQERVIAEVRKACAEFGFFQVSGHGISLELQKGLLNGIDTLFQLPQEAKIDLSYLKNPCRRGYEKSGMSLREGDAMPDSKEVQSTMSPFAQETLIDLNRRTTLAERTQL
jgi:isopenicillin N synthase-like dioxygenase